MTGIATQLPAGSVRSDLGHCPVAQRACARLWLAFDVELTSVTGLIPEILKPFLVCELAHSRAELTTAKGLGTGHRPKDRPE